MPPKRGQQLGDSDSSEDSSTIKKIKIVRGSEDEDDDGVVWESSKFYWNTCKTHRSSTWGWEIYLQWLWRDPGSVTIVSPWETIKDTSSFAKAAMLLTLWNIIMNVTLKQKKYQSLLDRHKKKHSSFVCDDCGEILTSHTAPQLNS